MRHPNVKVDALMQATLLGVQEMSLGCATVNKEQSI